MLNKASQLLTKNPIAKIAFNKDDSIRLCIDEFNKLIRFFFCQEHC